MKTISSKTKSFPICSEVNKSKLSLLFEKSTEIRKYRRQLSTLVNDDFLNFIEMTKFDFIKKYNPLNPKTISSQEAQKAIEDVFIAYDNKKEQFINNIKFKVQKELKFELYKRNTSHHKVGMTKKCSIIFQETKLTKVCTYLAKYYNENTHKYLQDKILEVDEQLKYLIEKDQIKKLENSKRFCSEVIHYLNKFGQRIINLALSKRNLSIKKATEFPINFQSLSYRGVNVINAEIIASNKNDKSKFNAFIILGNYGEKHERLEVPTKYSDKYHGELTRYTKKFNKHGKLKHNWGTAYTIVFKENKPVNISLMIEEEEDIPTDKTNFVGVDVNIKHNLFCTSNYKLFDLDRDMIDDFCEFLKRLDCRQQVKRDKGAPHPEHTLKQKRDLHYKINRIETMIKFKCSQLVQMAKKEGKDHIVLENLGNFAKGFTKSDEFEGIKYSRLVRILNFASIKKHIKSIGNKAGIQVTFIHPEYTSQTCPICGNIDKENRKSQEIFCCTECGFTGNADNVASVNIFNRMAADVLQSELLDKNEFGFEARRVGKEVVRSTIEKYYSRLNDDRLGTVASS